MFHQKCEIPGMNLNPLQEPAPSTEVEEVEFQVQELHRDNPSEGLPPAALYRPAAQTPLREGPAYRETGDIRGHSCGGLDWGGGRILR